MIQIAHAANAPTILFVTPVSPFKIASGAEQRSALMLAALAKLGVVDVLQLQQSENTQLTRDDQKGHRHVLAQVVAANWSPTRYQPKTTLTQDIAAALQRPMSDYQLVVARYVWPVCQLALPENLPLIADLDDFKYRYDKETPLSWANLKERLLKGAAHQLIRWQLKRFKAAFTVSEQDSHEVTALPTCYLPNIPMSHATERTAVPASKHVVFVGSMWYGPNVEAMNWYLAEVWPKVRASTHDAIMTIAGAASPIVRARWQTHPGVTAPGFVDDLEALYQDANLVVVPVHSGGGTNIKVLEAMAHKRPCLVSSFVAAAFGSQLTAGQDFLVARTAQEFAEQTVAALCMNLDLQKIADSGHYAVNQYFTHQQFETTIIKFAKTTLKAPATVK